MHQIAFTRFEIEQRQHSPNAVIGIHVVPSPFTQKPKEQRVYITAAGVALGKELGDHLAVVIKDCLEKEYESAIFVNATTLYIKANFKRDLLQPEIAAIFGLTNTQFCARFKDCFKMYYVDYINMLRIDYGKTLLETTQIDVRDVAAECNLNPGNFHKYFRYHVGMTPGAYRRQHDKQGPQNRKTKTTI